MGFDDPEMAREATNIDEAFDQASLLLGSSAVMARGSDQRSAAQSSQAGEEPSALGAPSGNDLDAGAHGRDDPFGAQGSSAGDGPSEDNLLGKTPSQAPRSCPCVR